MLTLTCMGATGAPCHRLTSPNESQFLLENLKGRAFPVSIIPELSSCNAINNSQNIRSGEIWQNEESQPCNLTTTLRSEDVHQDKERC